MICKSADSAQIHRVVFKVSEEYKGELGHNQQMYLSFMQLCEIVGVMTIKCEQSALEKKKKKNDEVKRKKTNKHKMNDVGVMMMSYYYLSIIMTKQPVREQQLTAANGKQANRRTRLMRHL